MTSLPESGPAAPVDGRVGRGLNPFAGFRDAITAEEARAPEVAAELQRRFRHTILFATLGTVPTAIGLGALMWLVAPSTGVVFWVLAALSTLGMWLVILRMPVGESWLRPATALQIYGGVIWGSLPLMAMPVDERWQIFMAAFGMGVQASSVLFAAQLRRLFYAFHLPNSVLSVTGFLLLADGAGRWGAALLAYAAVFATGLSEIHHLTALSASTFSIRSARLADGLSANSVALSEANERLVTQARTDPLTSLANRFEFDRRLAQVLSSSPERRGAVVAVAMLDLDRFKWVNDSLGHRVGDLLLVAVGKRLQQRLLPDETLARFGGDELVVLSPEAERGTGGAELGGRLSSAFVEPFVIDGRRLDIRASIGVVDSSASIEPGDLLRFADAALYQGKRQGGGRVEVFDGVLQEQLRQRREIEAELCSALGRGQLVPYLQPFVDLESGAVIGAESLVRWIHPDGIRVAGSFFEVVEELGLVDHLTHHLLDELTVRRLASPTLAPVPISVNVAPDHFRGLVDRYEDTQVLAGLMLEITEQARFDESVDGVNQLIGRARTAGARILLDDFGIGFSSLARAARLDVDGYKLDRLFIAELASDADARAVMAGVVEIAGRQGREVIAEGVETAEQARILADFGVTTAQGFLYSPAVPVEDFEDLVRHHRYAPTPRQQRHDRIWH